MTEPRKPSMHRIDKLAGWVLCVLVGWSACYVQFQIKSHETELHVLEFANQNWSSVYNDLGAKCFRKE